MTTTATPKPGVAASATIALNEINLLICHNGDSGMVAFALNAIAALLYRTEPIEARVVELGYEEAFGLACLLRTCSAALRAMSEGRHL